MKWIFLVLGMLAFMVTFAAGAKVASGDGTVFHELFTGVMLCAAIMSVGFFAVLGELQNKDS